MSTFCTTRILCGITLAAGFAATSLAGVSTCCIATGEPGCDDPTCEAQICAADPFCCNTAWDSICANAANQQCEVCDGGGQGDCPPAANDCFTTGGPGCSDVECCALICAQDPFCCDVAWDGVCVNAANQQCDGGTGGECPPATNDCFTTGGPGCSDAECCALVCAFDPFCCDVAWDGLCVNGAFSVCDVPPCDLECPPGASFEQEPCGADTNGGCNAPIIGDSDCCTPNPFPGCDDLDCAFAVCALDPFCCDVAWDGLCSGAALTLCPDLCELGSGAFEPISCGDTVCGTAWAVGGTRDTDWYELVLTEPTEVVLTLSAKFPSVVGVVNTGGVPDCSLAGALNPFGTAGPCGTVSVIACLGAGTHWIFVAVNGFDGWPCGENSDYVLTVECGGKCLPPACGNDDAGDCFIANGSPYCDDAECCLIVCSFDPFCCDVTWDALCADGAFNACVTCDIDCPKGALQENEPCGADTNGGCNAPIIGTSDCCTPNPFPGCDDLDCAFAVCALDPFCCDVAWDGLCSGAALTLCPDTCQLGAGAFEPIACGDTVCGTAWAVGGTRDTDWYEITVTEPTQIVFTATANFPIVIGLVNTGGIPDCGLASALNPFATAPSCQSASFVACLEPGTHWLFVAVNGFDGFPCGTSNDYVITLECGGECVAPGCGVAGTGSCLVSNGSPFCDDKECCFTVCSFDPFCCDVTWDGLCASAAADLCDGGGKPADCPDATNSCFETGGPGCNDLECCLVVCDFDPFCCEVAWDSLCVAGAKEACGGAPCPWDLTGDGQVDGADLGDLLNQWGPCPGCPADFTGDGLVDGADLGKLLTQWGPCP